MVLLARTLEQAAREPAANDTLGATLEQRIGRRRKQLRKRVGQACLKQDSAALHQARIAIKKLRYALELAHEAGRKRLGQELRFCKRLQSLLGDMHDTDVIVGTLQEHLATRSRLPGLARAWNKWLRETRRRQAQRATKFFQQSYLWLNAPAPAAATSSRRLPKIAAPSPAAESPPEQSAMPPTASAT